jgi:hypothetical protein
MAARQVCNAEGHSCMIGVNGFLEQTVTARNLACQFHDCAIYVSEIFQRGGLKEDTLRLK